MEKDLAEQREAMVGAGEVLQSECCTGSAGPRRCWTFPANSVLYVLVGPCGAFSWVEWVEVEGSHPSDPFPSDQVTSGTSA